jgi:hypothetical protein
VPDPTKLAILKAAAPRPIEHKVTLDLPGAPTLTLQATIYPPPRSRRAPVITLPSKLKAGE